MRYTSNRCLDHLEIERLVQKARSCERRRAFQNMHSSFEDPCQCLLNAIEPSSYIPPHRHQAANNSEFLFAVQGCLVVLIFDDVGVITESAILSHGALPRAKFAVEITPDKWHSVVAVTTGSVLLEVKSGPFNPKAAKEIAPWCPAEGDVEAEKYSQFLRSEALVVASVDG